MIRVLVVEDETPMLHGLSKMIEQVNSQFSVVCKALNGKVALEYLKQHTVDIVFTDINMPVLDGLQLLEQIYANKLDVYTIILTGYQDFSYAQKAIKFGVTDYLLKPINKQKLEDILNQIASKHYTKKITLQQDCLNQVMFQNSGEMLLKNRCFDDDGQQLLLMLLCAGTIPIVPPEITLPGAEYWKTTLDCEPVQELLGKFRWHVLLDGETSAEKVLVCRLSETDSQEALIRNLYTTLNSYNCPVSIIYETVEVLEDFKTVYKGLHKKLKRNAPYARSELYTDSKLPKNEYLRIPSHLYRQMKMAVENNDLESFQKIMCDVLEWLKRQRATQSNLIDVIKGVIEMSLNSMPLRNNNSPDYYWQLNNLIMASYTYDSLEKKILQLTKDMFENMDNYSDKTQLVEEIERYIEHHLSEPLNNQILSAKFGFSSNYIARLFKQKTEKTPTEYIQTKRVEKAKELLRLDGKLKSKDIAQIVGYSDALYFSRVFKKETGMYPSEYKKTKGRKTQNA